MLIKIKLAKFENHPLHISDNLFIQKSHHRMIKILKQLHIKDTYTLTFNIKKLEVSRFYFDIYVYF